MNYVIASGWWSCPSEDDDREKLLGDDAIREVSFHDLWRGCINRFTSAKEIIVVDSASPRKPINISGEKWLSMRTNFGHATRHIGQFSGYTRAIFLSMMYAYTNDYDYWVYIEQDALIFGDKIIEKSIGESKKPVVFGSGEGTPQQIQQSFMIFHRDEIPKFIQNYTAIEEKDLVISPEWKFVFSQNRLARILPIFALKWLTQRSRSYRLNSIRRASIKFLRRFDEFDTFKFGFGRARPIDFSSRYMYFQHASKEELVTFERKLKKND